MGKDVIAIYVYMLWLPHSLLKQKAKMARNKLKLLIRATERLDR